MPENDTIIISKEQIRALQYDEYFSDFDKKYVDFIKKM